MSDQLNSPKRCPNQSSQSTSSLGSLLICGYCFATLTALERFLPAVLNVQFDAEMFSLDELKHLKQKLCYRFKTKETLNTYKSFRSEIYLYQWTFIILALNDFVFQIPQPYRKPKHNHFIVNIKTYKRRTVNHFTNNIA